MPLWRMPSPTSRSLKYAAAVSIMRYPLPIAASTARTVSAGGLWNTPSPKAGMMTPLFNVRFGGVVVVEINTSIAFYASHPSRGSTHDRRQPLRLRQDAHGCRPSAGTDHRVQVRTVRILRPIGVVDAIVHRAVKRFEHDGLCHTSRSNSAGLLSNGRLIPAGLLAVVAPNVQPVIDDNGPDPGRRPVGHAVLAERRDVQIVRFRDPAQFLGFPFHCVLLEGTS